MKTRFFLTLFFSTAIVFAYGQDVLSSKQNIPAKKETFASKLERFKSEGFKVGVQLMVTPLITKLPADQANNFKNITLKGEVEMESNDFIGLAENYASKMNEAFNTDVFEVVDMSQIPKKETNWGVTYEWGATKYKMATTYLISPTYDFNNFQGKKKAKFLVNQNATMAEYVYDKKKGSKIKYIVRDGGLGFYTLDYAEEGALDGLKTVEELHAIVNPPMGADLAAELQKAADEKMPEYIAKLKK